MARFFKERANAALHFSRAFPETSLDSDLSRGEAADAFPSLGMPGAGLIVNDAPGFHRFDLPMKTPSSQDLSACSLSLGMTQIIDQPLDSRARVFWRFSLIHPPPAD